MTRVFSSACVVLLLVALGGRASAGAKPPIAILGLEVYDNGSGIDPDTTKAAKELTAALRDRAKAGTGPYVPVPGGDKELIDEKLLNNCDSEAPVCMAAIGVELGAEILMYGKIEKSAQNGQTVYKVSLKVLNVGRKQLASSTVETLPLGDATGGRALAHAKNWYAKLAGVTSGGTVVVKANIDRGTVIVDDDVKGNLASGTLTIPGIAEGRHTLAIEAKDFQRYETVVTVRTGETLSHTATLAELSKGTTVGKNPMTIEGTVTTKTRSKVWKPLFIGATVLEAGLAAFTYYEWHQSDEESHKVKTDPPVGNGTCFDKDPEVLSQPNYVQYKALYQSACKHYKLQLVGWGGLTLVGITMIGSFVMAFIHDGDAPDTADTKAARNGHRKRRELAVTPIVTSDGAGATLRFDW
jgi:hypothetical protein